jgi:tight adherence protein B
MELLIVILTFLTVTFLIWGLYLIFAGGEKQIEKRLHSYTQTGEKVETPKERVKPGKESGITFLDGVKSQLEKKGWAQQLELELQKADLPMKGSEMVMVMIGAPVGGILLFWIIIPNILGPLLGGILGYLAPTMFVRVKQTRRLKKFNTQINDCLTMISNSLKAGYSFFLAIDLVSREMPEPISKEFGRVLKEMNLGASTEEALEDMVKRVGSNDMDMVVQAVLIQRQVGGNLAEVLDKIAFTIRERIRIKAEIKTITAQGRMSGIIIALMPVALALMLATMNPEYFSLLWTTTIGKVMIAFAVLLEMIGIMVIRKIVNIRI